MKYGMMSVAGVMLAVGMAWAGYGDRSPLSIPDIQPGMTRADIDDAIREGSAEGMIELKSRIRIPELNAVYLEYIIVEGYWYGMPETANMSMTLKNGEVSEGGVHVYRGSVSRKKMQSRG